MEKGNRVSVGVLAAVGVLAMSCAVFFSWKRGENLRFVAKMGNGINLGNTLDTANVLDYKPDASELEYETYWGNLKVDKKQLQAIYRAGFRCVRIPVTWEEHMDEEGNISEIWMNRVQEVVDMAMAEHLYVIINTHHEKWLDLDSSKEKEIAKRYSHVWGQIAERFANYDDHLLFEGMNEPRVRDSEHEWDGGDTKLRTMVNHLNRVFIETVRRNGAENKNRYLLIGTYDNISTADALKELEVPGGHVIVSVHAYLPYGFCQAKDGTANWNAENPEDTQEIEQAFRTMSDLFVKKSIPVILTEFGCMDKDNLKERLAWTAFYKKLSGENQISLIWWDNGSHYALLDRENSSWIYPELTEVLTGKYGWQQ